MASKRRHKGERLAGTDDDKEEKEEEKEEKFRFPKKVHLNVTTDTETLQAKSLLHPPLLATVVLLSGKRTFLTF